MTQSIRSMWWPGALIAAMEMIAGIWFGEEPPGPVPAMQELLLALVLSVALALVLRRHILPRLGVGVAGIALFVGAWRLGNLESSRAYNSCVSNGNSILLALHAYKARRGMYPVRLSELGLPLPGQRALRGSRLDYMRTEQGFEISYGDWLISNTANQDSKAFSARK